MRTTPRRAGRRRSDVALPLTRNTRLVSGATRAARRAAATSPACGPAGRSSARQTASSARLPSVPEAACSPHTNDVSKPSSTARTASEAATDMAVSKSSPSAQAGAASSTTISAWLRRVSRYCRTSSWLSPAAAIGLGRRAPVHVAQVVAGDVLAQRVEGQVALGHGVGGHALEVAEQPGAERVERHHRRAHQHLARRRSRRRRG